MSAKVAEIPQDVARKVITGGLASSLILNPPKKLWGVKSFNAIYLE
jgi:hypothetical protein